jgi:hypothetical protein
VPAGTTLLFARDAGIVLRGALDLQGTAAAPVRLEPLADAGTWPGVLVLDAPQKSTWTHAVVRGTAGHAAPGWTLAAGVLFHGSEVELRDCRLEDNACEDALNLFQCRYRLVRLTIARCRSDAFDGDFGGGELLDCAFEDVGDPSGDAIDVSGATVTVRGARMRNVRDKALSVGEGSTLVAEDVVAEDVGTGMACKDGSQATLRASTIRRARHAGVMSYCKKARYGPASARVDGVAIEASKAPFLRNADGSRLVVDGREVPATAFDVDALYQTGPMKKN